MESSRREDNAGEYNRDLNVKKARLNSTLAALLDDPILADVPKNPTLSDVDTLISLELGSAMRVSVLKLDGSAFGAHSRLSPFLSISAWHFYKHLTITKDNTLKESDTKF